MPATKLLIALQRKLLPATPAMRKATLARTAPLAQLLVASAEPETRPVTVATKPVISHVTAPSMAACKALNATNAAKLATLHDTARLAALQAAVLVPVPVPVVSTDDQRSQTKYR
jgi:hypothetical protein